MDRSWIIDQWLQLAWLVVAWGCGVWAWSGDYQPGDLSVPACWTLIWAVAQEHRMAVRELAWAQAQTRRDWEEIQYKVDWFIRNNVTIDLRLADEEEEEEDGPNLH